MEGTQTPSGSAPAPRKAKRLGRKSTALFSRALKIKKSPIHAQILCCIEDDYDWTAVPPHIGADKAPSLQVQEKSNGISVYPILLTAESRAALLHFKLPLARPFGRDVRAGSHHTQLSVPKIICLLFLLIELIILSFIKAISHSFILGISRTFFRLVLLWKISLEHLFILKSLYILLV